MGGVEVFGGMTFLTKLYKIEMINGKEGKRDMENGKWKMNMVHAKCEMPNGQ